MTFYIPKKALLMCATRLRVTDVFATSLYTGNGGTQTITNGLDLAGKGGLGWIKSRTNTSSHGLGDTQRGFPLNLYSNLTNAEDSLNGVTSVSSTGFGLGVSSAFNGSQNYVAWSFRRAKKFFDIVTYTGNGQYGRQIPHGLGDVPGMIVVKARDTTSAWFVQHRSISPSNHLRLNQTDGTINDGGTVWNGVSATASVLTLGSGGANANGVQYVAYLFAHNPDLIQCGSFTKSGNRTPVVLGWRPQFLMVKRANGAGAWEIYDSARGFPQNTSLQQNARVLFANASQAEAAEFSEQSPTGFLYSGGTDGNYIFIAIREPT